MESVSKTQITCDNCRSAIRLPTKGAKTDEKKQEPLALEAMLEDGLGNVKDYHLCSEECLRVFLNSRAKKNKSKASVLEIDIPNRSKTVFLKTNL